MLFGVLFSSKSSITENFTTVDQLKQAIVEERNKLSQSFIDRSIDEWRRRLPRGPTTEKNSAFLELYCMKQGMSAG